MSNYPVKNPVEGGEAQAGPGGNPQVSPGATDDIVKEAATFGLGDVYVRRLVDELKRQGDLYEPKVGHVKLSRKESGLRQ